MEKASNNNSQKLSKMLQKAMSVGHSATSFSPVRDFQHHRTASTARRGFFFSSPITPLIPSAARCRRRTKNGGVFAEPTSPKVSCIGQIKLAKPEKKKRGEPKNPRTGWSLLSPSIVKEVNNKGSFTKLKRLFSTRKPTNSIASSAMVVDAVVATPSLSKMKKFASTREALTGSIAAVEADQVVAAPSLGKMKKFASSREPFAGCDWTVDRKSEESLKVHHYSIDEDVTIPCSVKIPLSQAEGLSMCPKPKSEVNLWKRRSMDRPKPLQVKATY